MPQIEILGKEINDEQFENKRNKLLLMFHFEISGKDFND